MTEMFAVKREEKRYLPDPRCRAAARTPDYTRAYQEFMRNLEAFWGRKDKPAVVWHSEGGEEQRLTCDGFYRRVMRCANDRRSLDVEKGDRVCISMSFAPDLIVVAGHNIGTADALKENVIKAFVSLRVGVSPSSGLIDDLEG